MNIMAVRWSRLYRGTVAEHSLEEAIAEIGVPYRTQYPGYQHGLRYFPDFLLPTLKLVIEVDDPSHDDEEKAEADRQRTLELEREWGVRVLRCTNAEALENPRGTVRRLLASVGMWPVPDRLPPLTTSFPPRKKCPQKIRREIKSAETQRKRKD